MEYYYWLYNFLKVIDFSIFHNIHDIFQENKMFKCIEL